MKYTVLQVPMSKELREKALKASKEMGFSSLQETTRILLTKLSEKKLQVNIQYADEIELSPAAIKRYNKIAKDIKDGKNVYKPKTKKNFLKRFMHKRFFNQAFQK